VAVVEPAKHPRRPAHLPPQRDSIEAHLNIVFAALAVSKWIEAQTGWSIGKFVKTARRYHSGFRVTCTATAALSMPAQT
jgi:hypothetical protein